MNKRAKWHKCHCRSAKGSTIPYPYSLAFQWSNVWSGKIKVIKVRFPWVIFPISERHLFSSSSVGMDSALVFRLAFEIGSAFIGSWYLNFSPFLSGSKKCIRASTWICLCFSPQEKTKLFLPSKYSLLNCTQTILRAQGEITDRSSSSSFLYLSSAPMTIITLPPTKRIYTLEKLDLVFGKTGHR